MAIGERVLVLDAATRVRGNVPYVLNSDAPNALVGAVLRSHHPHAHLVRVDATRAAQVPGVHGIVTRDDLTQDPRLSPYFGPLERDQPLLAMDSVRYVGEPLAAVAAEDADAAEEALSLIEVDYAPLESVLTIEAASKAGGIAVHPGKGNVVAECMVSRGDVSVGFAQADGVLEAVYTTPTIQHVSLEPHVVLASVGGDGRILVQSSTQTPHHLRRQLADIFGVPMSQVRVTVPTLGGGFGGKCYPEIEPIAVLLAQKTRRPVKMTLSRAEEFVTTARHATELHVKSGHTRDGKIVAVEARLLYDNGAYMETADRVVRHAARALTAPYQIPHVKITAVGYYTTSTPCGPFRAPGAAQAVFAMESHLDEVARAIGIDGLELRLRNVVTSGSSYVDGGLLEGIRYPEMLKNAAEAVGWHQPKMVLPSGELVGRGLALVMKTTNTPSTSTATVKMNEDGSLDVLTSSVEMGQGAGTVLAQIAAEHAGVDLPQVHISYPDTDVTPYDQATSSSRTTFAMGEAISLAVEDVTHQLRELAATHFEADPEDIELARSQAFVRGALDRTVSYAALVRTSRAGNLLGSAVNVTSAKPDPVTGKPGASAHYHQAAGGAEVAVDPETGRVRVLRLHAAVFAGRAINPTLCELQTDGSSFFGLGQSLFEQMHMDGGQVTNANLGDYLIPALGDLPDVLESAIYEDRAHDEVHGIGEVSAPLAPPAIANAIADAVGVRITDLPLTPERILHALRVRSATTASTTPIKTTATAGAR